MVTKTSIHLLSQCRFRILFLQSPDVHYLQGLWLDESMRCAAHRLKQNSALTGLRTPFDRRLAATPDLICNTTTTTTTTLLFTSASSLFFPSS